MVDLEVLINFYLLGKNNFPEYLLQREIDDEKQEHSLISCTFGRNKSFKQVYMVLLLLHRFGSQVLYELAKKIAFFILFCGLTLHP